MVEHQKVLVINSEPQWEIYSFISNIICVCFWFRILDDEREAVRGALGNISFQFKKVLIAS